MYSLKNCQVSASLRPAGLFVLIPALFATLLTLLPSSAAAAPPIHPGPAITSLAPAPLFSNQPDFGSNVYVFNPSMSLSDIQATVNEVANEQISNQFGTQRFALLFEPGTYGSSANPLIFQVGYYTSVAGLGQNPGDVVINGAINVSNQCDSTGSCTALDNFWRSVSNLTINVVTASACTSSAEFWAVSQAAPVRRVNINGNLFLFDYCSGPGYASGGFIADSAFENGTIISATQQ
ncbi:MAG TPA: hypothetical protein VMU43_07890, partial [Candidatus Acidoferrum sp.]|nr:hypothetical protein [Candidatus Acidoferrum sp.]